MPVAATKHTAAGARAFAEFFFRTIDWAYATTSTTYMRHHYEQSCVACNSTAIAVDKAAHQRHRFIGDRFTVVSAVTQGQSVLVTFDVSSVEVVDHVGDYVAAAPALHGYQELISPTWRGEKWVVGRMVPQ